MKNWVILKKSLVVILKRFEFKDMLNLVLYNFQKYENFE